MRDGDTICNRLTTCTADPIEDCGSGVRIERRYLDGSLDGIAWWHLCNGVDREDFMVVQPAWRDGWIVVQVRPLTVSPSILCRVCQFSRLHSRRPVG